jgi:hypothetical protein
MRTSTVIPVGFVIACLSLLLPASPAYAQCGVNTLGYGNIGIVKDNPFRAEIVITFTPPLPLAESLRRKPELVARDTQGRIRTERVVGEYKRNTGAEAGSTAEQRLIIICDPVAQTLTQIDTLNATARIIHSRPSALNSLRPVDPNAPHFEPRPVHTFCESRLMLGARAGRFGADDLGFQTIEGVQAHGTRTTIPAIAAPSNEVSAINSTTERWCSDDLSAIVLTVSGNSTSDSKTSIAMQKIERTEPDPSLFQIPPDYAVTESVTEPHSSQVTTATQP